MYRRWIGILLLGAVAAALAPAPRGGAEDERPPRRAEKLPPDLEFVYQSGGSFVALRPGDLLDAAPMKQLAPDMRDHLAERLRKADQSLGLPVAAAERVTILLSSTVAAPVLVVRTTKPYDGKTLLREFGKEMEEIKEKGRTLFVQPDRAGRSLYPIDDRTYAVGPASGLRQMIVRADAENTPRPHGLAVEWAAANHQAVLGSTAEPLLALVVLSRTASDDPPATIYTPRRELRPVPVEREGGIKDRPGEKKPAPPDPVKEGPGRDAALRQKEKPDIRPAEKPEERPPEPDLKAMLAELPLAALPFKPLLQAQSIAVALDLGTESKVRCQLTFADADTAADAETASRAVLYVWRELLGRMPDEVGASRESRAKLLPLIKDVQAALRAASVQRRGVTVEGGLTLKTDEKTVGPFLAEAEKAANSAQARNNLLQIGVAMHSAHDVYGALPNAAICDKAAKPLLSWRVAILPFIEEDNLYKQFKLDEPWDSPNNIKLLDRMPRTYALPMRPAKGKGETFFRVFTGRDTPFDLSRVRPGPVSLGLRITDFQDGTSNTLLVVEAAESVPWTKPDDLPYDARKPLPKLGGATPGQFFALFADGHVRTLSTKVDEVVLRALITPAGGEVVVLEPEEPSRTRPPRRDPEPGPVRKPEPERKP